MFSQPPEKTAFHRIERAYDIGAKELDLSELALTQIPPEIGKLTQVEELSLSHNLLTTLPIEIGNLKRLKKLYLKDNKFSVLPQVLFQFEYLEKLSLVDNQLREISREFNVFQRLIWLAIGNNFYASTLEKAGGNNYFSEIPDVIWELTNLEELYVTAAGLTLISPLVGQLTKLKGIYLTTNFISDLPKEIKSLQCLSIIQIQNNPIPIPLEIVELQDAKVILDYYFLHYDDNKQPMREAKILVVGQGSVGKTSLVERILKNTFVQQHPKTDGILISRWIHHDYSEYDDFYVTSSIASPPPLKINVWDFGGQEIMHSTHQFFLTKRSLYLLVLDARLTQEENRVEYWLKIIESFGGGSPVLVIGNKIDQHPLDIDRLGLQKKYPNIVGILETSAATGLGIKELKDTVTEQIKNLPYVNDLLPKTWLAIKSVLEEMGPNQNFISQDSYVEICKAFDVRDEVSQKMLIGFLHDLGVVLNFQEDPRLEMLGILNPKWVTNGVYKIINSPLVFQNKGVLLRSMLDKILDFPEYPTNKRIFIVDMMRKFGLCYDIEPDNIFLVPDLLPKDEPSTGNWDTALAFQYHYNVLPSSIITRFIVRMNAFIHETVWRSGVVLKLGGNTALVKADLEDRKISIWVSGEDHKRRDFLTKIRGEFDAIHAKIAKIEAREMVPVPSHPEIEPVVFDLLLQMEHNNVEDYPVLSAGKMLIVNVKEMLNGVESEIMRSQRERSGKVTNIYVTGDMSESIIITGDENKVK